MTEIIFLFAAGITGLVLQTTSMGFTIPADYKPDIILALVVWSGLRATYMAGVVFAFIIGLCVDMLSGSPTGFFALIYCLAFVAAGYVDSVAPIDDPAGWAATVCFASIASGCLVLMMRWMAGPVGFGVHTLVWILVKSLVTGGVAVALLSCLDKAWAGYSRMVGAR